MHVTLASFYASQQTLDLLGVFCVCDGVTLVTAHFDLFSFRGDPCDYTLYIHRINYIYRYKQVSQLILIIIGRNGV